MHASMLTRELIMIPLQTQLHGQGDAEFVRQNKLIHELQEYVRVRERRGMAHSSSYEQYLFPLLSYRTL